MTIRWITPLLGTAAFNGVQGITDITVVDVRDLVDKAGNNSNAILNKIHQAIDLITQGKRTVVCCDYGMSRSNAIAVGIIVNLEKIPFNQALRQVQEATGEAEIKLDPLNAVRQALGVNIKKAKYSQYRNILITGGRGFIGTALQEALINSEFRLISPTREQIDIVAGSTKLDLLASEENIDCIVHLANPRVYTSNIAMGHTLTMLRNIIDVCLAKDIPLIYPSGWEIYSGYAGTIHVDESTPALPRGPYGETKYLSELLIEHCCRTRGLRCAMLRSSPVYGSMSDKPKFIFNFFKKAIQGQKIVTHRYMNGNPKLDLLHIDDFVSSIIATLKSRFIGNLNIGTGQLNSTLQIAEMIRDELGSPSMIEQIEVNTEVASIAMNYGRANLELGWEPITPFNQGLKSLLSQISTN
ncbi:NAD-dependent epimerase/dehydratase family protein [Spirulina major]|uniref:NAD-dependent epimerase/dehydratase family protein n=1 Tax=Spirulina major TaxID=270636 RepID=UPI00093236AB|nr:NAD-dependent epimerase/dehydratase family protein [Spirulina major]